MRTVGHLVQCINEWGVKRVKVDNIGIGWALTGRLRELSSVHNPSGSHDGLTTHSAEVVGVNFGERPTEGSEHKFLNKRAEVYWNVGRELSRLRQWDLGEVDDDTIAELTASQYEIMDSYGKIKIEPKDKIIERLGASPDRAEALLLAFYAPRSIATPLDVGSTSLLPGGRSREDVMQQVGSSQGALMPSGPLGGGRW
jgi:hypothetical protein